MIITYDEYQSNGGTKEEEVFKALLPFADRAISSYIHDSVAYWRLPFLNKTSDLVEIYAATIDAYEEYGGADALKQSSSLTGIQTIQTDGFTLNYGSDSASDFYEGMYFPEYLQTRLKLCLRQQGLLYRGFYNV